MPVIEGDRNKCTIDFAPKGGKSTIYPSETDPALRGLGTLQIVAQKYNLSVEQVLDRLDAGETLHFEYPES